MKVADFTYWRYRGHLKRLQIFLAKFSKKDFDRKTGEAKLQIHELLNLQEYAPKLVAFIKGYGLKTQRDIIKLELNNAKLSGATKKKIVKLQLKLKEFDKQLEFFLKKNVDTFDYLIKKRRKAGGTTKISGVF